MNGLSIAAIAPPPLVEVDVQVRQDNKLIEQFGSELSRHLSDCWERAKFSKTEITERIYNCKKLDPKDVDGEDVK